MPSRAYQEIAFGTRQRAVGTRNKTGAPGAKSRKKLNTEATTVERVENPAIDERNEVCRAALTSGP